MTTFIIFIIMMPFFLTAWLSPIQTWATWAQNNKDNIETTAGISGGLTLEQATQLAISANLDLLAARYSISSAEADELTAGLWNNPSVLLDTVGQPFGGNWNQTAAGGPRQYDMIFSLPIDASGKRSASVKSAQAATEIAKAAFQDMIRQKILQVRLAYMDLLVAGYQLGLSKERQESMNRLVTMIENRIGNQGRLPLLQRRARLALDQAVLDTRQRETGLRIAKTALAILLGRSPMDPSVEATSKLRAVELPNELLKSMPKDLPKDLEDRALAERPDLKALRLTANKADRDADLAHAQVWDNFTITAGLTHYALVSANPGDPTSNSQPGSLAWNASLTIPLPLLNRNSGNIAKAEITKTQVEKQIQALSLAISQELLANYEQLRLNEGLIRDYEGSQLANARKVRDSQQTLFGTGGSALLDYFDAVNAYQSTLSSYYDVVAEYRRGLARLNASIGKDLFK